MRAEASAAFQRNKDGLDQTKLNIKQRARATRVVLSVEIKYIGRHQYGTVRYLAAHSVTHRVSSARPQPERRAPGDVHTRPMHAYPAYGESRGAKRRAVATSLQLSVTGAAAELLPLALAVVAMLVPTEPAAGSLEGGTAIELLLSFSCL